MIPWHLYGFATLGLLVLVLVAIAARRISQGGGAAKSGGTLSLPEDFLDGLWMFDRRATLLTENEQRFLVLLEQVLRGKYRVAVQVHLGAIVDLPKLPDPAIWARHEAALNRRLDFVVMDPAFRAVGVIEFDDPANPRRDRARGDHKLESVLASLKIPLLRMPAEQAGDPKAVWKALHDAFGGG